MLKVFSRLNPSADGTAYETLIEDFLYAVFNLIGKLIDDPADVPRLTEEVFRCAFRNISGLRYETSPKTSMYRIAVRTVSNRFTWFRWRRNRREVCGGRTHPIEGALRNIGSTLRVTLVLREVESLSYEEISQILGVSLEAVGGGE